jgi:hypothetical protein
MWGGDMTDIEFTGMDALHNKLAGILAKIAGKPVVKVGFFEGSTAGWNGPRPINRDAKSLKWKKSEVMQARSETVHGSDQPAAYVASILNFGNPKNGMQPRPFWDEWKERGVENWGNLLAAALKQHEYNAKDALEMCGLKMAEELQLGINTFDGEPLKQGTIDTKGFDQPLIDSHNMINAIDFRVEA